MSLTDSPGPGVATRRRGSNCREHITEGKQKVQKGIISNVHQHQRLTPSDRSFCSLYWPADRVDRADVVLIYPRRLRTLSRFFHNNISQMCSFTVCLCSPSVLLTDVLPRPSMFAKEHESDLPAIAVKIALLLTHRVFMKKDLQTRRLEPEFSK